MYLNVIGFEDVHYTHVGQDTDYRQAVLNTAMNLWILQKMEAA
jgi:hypothetical protein